MRTEWDKFDAHSTDRRSLLDGDRVPAKAERTLYRPYGNWDTSLTWQSATAAPVPESHGYIGERLDADAGLLFLNARYMDPQLAMFIQPDWWEVTEPGVGTNRNAYAGGDPVDGSDPGGIRRCRPLNRV